MIEQCEKSLITVIVPVYNVEIYIDKCMGSITSQTYKNLEIIIVNDGSTDNSLSKCEEWQSKDRRISIITKVNGGLASARNAGLDRASGEYISFLDSDDYIDEDMYEKMIFAFKTDNVDIVSCGVKEIYQDGLILEKSNLKCGLFNQEDALTHLLLWDGIVCSYACNKLYKQSLIADTRFDETLLYGEDCPFIYELLTKCNGYFQIDGSKYNYMRREDSLVGNTFNSKHLISIQASINIRDKCSQDYKKLCKVANCHVAMNCYFILDSLLSTKHGMKRFKKEYIYLRNTMSEIPYSDIREYYSTKRSVQWWIIKNFSILFILLKRITKQVKGCWK